MKRGRCRAGTRWFSPAFAFLCCLGWIFQSSPVSAQSDSCASATAIASLPFTQTASVASATTDPGDPDLICVESFPARPGEATVWYSFTPSKDQVLEVSTEGSDYDTILAIYRGDCATPTLIECVDQHVTLGDQSRGYVVARKDETLLIEVASDEPSPQSLTISVAEAPDGHPAKDAPEFVVNDSTAGVQGAYYYGGHSVCSTPDGKSVIVFEDQSHPDISLFGQRYDADGMRVGNNFPIDATDNSGYHPVVACESSGAFVVVWNENSVGHQARRFDSDATPASPEVNVSPWPTKSDQASVMVDDSGNFVVVYEKNDVVMARRLDASGTPLGPEFQVSVAEGYQPDIAGNPDGEWVVSFDGGSASSLDPSGGDEPYQIFARRGDTSGALGSQLVVSDDEDTYRNFPAVSMNESGEFVVTWVRRESYSGDLEVVAQKFETGGVSDGPRATATSYPLSLFPDEMNPDVGMDADGAFVVAWGDRSNDGYSVVARRFDESAASIGQSEFSVETESIYPQYGPAVASAANGNFVVAWTGYDGDSSCGYLRCDDAGIHGQHFVVDVDPLPSQCPALPESVCLQSTAPLKSPLVIRNDDFDRRDQVRWKWVKGEATDVAEFGDPTVDEGYSLCLYDESGPAALIYGARIQPSGTCRGRPCWKAGKSGFKFKDKDREPHGVVQMNLKAGSAGKPKITVNAGLEDTFASDVGAPPLPLPLPARMQLINDSGQCWESVYDAAGVRKNDDETFRGKGS